MLKELLNVILIEIGFKVDPTLNPIFRSRNQRINLTIFLALLSHFVLSPVLFGSSCLIQGWIGFPCPTCGSTRAFAALIQGNFSEAMKWHPLIIFSLLILIVALISHLLNGLQRQRAFKAGIELEFKRTSSRFMMYVFSFILVIYFGLYFYRLIRFWPEPPMNYNYQSALGRLYLLIKGIF